MGYFVDSYERNKKYLVAFAVLAFCIAVIYTKRLVDFPKIGVGLMKRNVHVRKWLNVKH